jgi:hypothetical protein
MLDLAIRYALHSLPCVQRKPSSISGPRRSSLGSSASVVSRYTTGATPCPRAGRIRSRSLRTGRSVLLVRPVTRTALTDSLGHPSTVAFFRLKTSHLWKVKRKLSQKSRALLPWDAHPKNCRDGLSSSSARGAASRLSFIHVALRLGIAGPATSSELAPRPHSTASIGR